MTINTQVVSACSKIRAYTVKNSDDSYTIFINDNVGYEERLRAYQHEMKHITQNDFYNENIQIIEKKAHE